jgi:hypothetical protein
MATSGMYVPEEVQEFDAKPLRIEKPVIALKGGEDAVEFMRPKPTEELEVIESKPQEALEAPKELPVSPLTMLGSMMWSDEIPDAHVIHFLIAKKIPNVTKATTLKEINEKVIERLIAKWDDVKAFKPIL